MPFETGNSTSPFVACQNAAQFAGQFLSRDVLMLHGGV